MDITILISFVTCIIFILILGKFFLFPVKKILTIITNSILGGLAIWLINVVGTSFNFHIGLNVITALIAGILGIPGVILLILLKIFCGIG